MGLKSQFASPPAIPLMDNELGYHPDHPLVQAGKAQSKPGGMANMVRSSKDFSESVEELALPKSIKGGKLSLAKANIRRISVSVPARSSSGECRPDMIFVN